MIENELYNGNRSTISFITTHPNVSISLFKVFWRDTYLEVFRNHNIKEKTRNNKTQYDTNKNL
jgi:hypothetical protein